MNLRITYAQKEIELAEVYVCGLFAIAFSTALCDGVDPHGLALDQSAVRYHL